MSTQPPQSAERSAWPAQAERLSKAFYEWVRRPRVTLCLAGILLAFGGLLMTNSVWTLPLVIVGAVMVVVAWVGHRLEGRVAVEWGRSGTELAIRATVKPARHVPATAIGGSDTQQLAPAPPTEDRHDEVIEGEAHTVEVDMAELKALIAAAQTPYGDRAKAETPVQDIRIRRVGENGARSAEAP
jgi:hypothetical protein